MKKRKGYKLNLKKFLYNIIMPIICISLLTFIFIKVPEIYVKEQELREQRINEWRQSEDSNNNGRY